MTSTAILIPARYGSTRFHGKPLTMLGGKTMIQRVTETCVSTGIDTFVLTDNKTIAQAAKAAGAKSFIESVSYRNGTERCNGALKSEMFDEYTHFINVQGDMPDVTPEMIHHIRGLLHVSSVCTLYTKMDPKLKLDPNTVKMIHNGNKAHWFGRGFTYGDHHLGIYGYTRQALLGYMRTEPDEYEQIEQLEQLRWYKGGVQISIHGVEWNGIEINTPEDVEKWNEAHL